MKIGRNDLCPCGSGKKYKKCCLDKEESTSINYDKRYFELKGKNAEEFVYGLAQKSFLTDWCFINPKWDDGKELCDLLVVFGDKAIIWQIKDLKKGEDGKYNKNEVEKNLRQLLGAKRKLFELNKSIELENPRRGKELFDSRNIKEVYLISDLVGEGEDFYEFVKKIKDKIIHVLDRKGTEILLNELDTISDFVSYLKEKARLNRFERRFKAKTFFEGQAKASLEKKNNFFRRTVPDVGITYCFLYARAPNREARKNRLAEVCFATRGYFKQNQRVLGIATEMDLLNKHSFEFCLLDFPEWTDKEEKIADDIKEKLGIFKNQEMSHFTDDEYPKL